MSDSLKTAQRSLGCESDLMTRMLRFLSFLPGFLSPSTPNPTPGWKLEMNNSSYRAPCEYIQSSEIFYDTHPYFTGKNTEAQRHYSLQVRE